MSNTIASLAFCVSLMIYSATLGTTRPQESNEIAPLDRVMSTFEMRDATVEEAVGHILVSNHLSGGMALSFGCADDAGPVEAKHFFNLSGLPVRHALNQILSNDRSYRWVEENKAIIVYPVRGMPELLKAKVDHFEIDSPKYTLSSASGDLLRTPEIKKRAIELDLKRGVQYIVGAVDSRERLSSKISVNNVTMYEALNAIAMANGSTVWRYSEYRCGKVNELSITWIVR